MDLHGAPLDAYLGETWRARRSGGRPKSIWGSGKRLELRRPHHSDRDHQTIKLKGTFRDSVRDNTQTEERIVKAVKWTHARLDEPLQFDHTAEGAYRGDVANLSRNIVIESADPTGERGHVMYHAHSSGSISYAEFRHLGKQGVLGRYICIIIWCATPCEAAL